MVATEPDFTTLPSELPKVIREILVRCLEKDPLQRLRDIGDVRITIGRVLSGPTHMQAPGGAERVMDESAAYGERRGWVALGATMLVAAVATGVWLLPADNETSPEWFSILPPQSTSGVAPEPALSPDGQSVLFRARNSAGAITLWVRKFDAPAAREIPETEGAYLPFWSQDGTAVAFFAPFQSPSLRRVDVAGGASPQVLTRVQNPRGADWGEDDL